MGFTLRKKRLWKEAAASLRLEAGVGEGGLAETERNRDFLKLTVKRKPRDLDPKIPQPAKRVLGNALILIYFLFSSPSIWRWLRR